MTAPLYVIAVVCMIASPDVCQDIPADDPIEGGIGSMVECFLVAETTAAQWIDSHPGWEFRRGSCTPEPPPPKERDT